MNFDRMRALLLDRAIHGQLVSQDADDGVVKQIGMTPDADPFTLPKSWRWIKLKELVIPAKQTIPAENFTYIDVSSIKNFQLEGTKRLEPSNAPSRARKVVQEGMVLFATVRPYLKNICIAKNLSGNVIASTAFATMSCSDHLDNRYLFYVLRSDYFTELVKGKQRGISYPAISERDFYACHVPVPPVKEQARIVAKLEEAFAEIDRAKKAYEELQTLAGVLRGQILQEAIEGKLVPQLAEEGVVEQIGGAPEEVPFEIPESWKWVQMNGICTLKSGVDMSPSVLLNEPVINAIPYITGGSQIGQSGELLITRWTSKATNISEEGDVLLICKGSGLGRTALNSYGSVHIARQIMAIRKTKEVIPQYLDLLLKWHWETLRSAAKGVIPGIARKDVLSLLVPLPPVTEQVRIVAKVEELMKQVDGLSA
mgnify:FL=1